MGLILAEHDVNILKDHMLGVKRTFLDGSGLIGAVRLWIVDHGSEISRITSQRKADGVEEI